MLDMKALLSEFSAHVASMSDDDVRESIQNAERLTAGCENEVGDIKEYDISACDETESQSIAISSGEHCSYFFISSYFDTSNNSETEWVFQQQEDAA